MGMTTAEDTLLLTKCGARHDGMSARAAVVRAVSDR